MTHILYFYFNSLRRKTENVVVVPFTFLNDYISTDGEWTAAQIATTVIFRTSTFFKILEWDTLFHLNLFLSNRQLGLCDWELVSVATWSPKIKIFSCF